MSADVKAPATAAIAAVEQPKANVKTKHKTPQFTARRTVALERHLWFTDLQGRTRGTAGAPAGVAGAAAAPPQRDVEDVCVTLREYDTAAAVNGAAALVDATPRNGLSAAMAAAHLVAKLRLPVVADFVSSEFPVSVSIVRGEIANSVRLHGDARVCVLVSDVKFAASSTGDAVVRLLAAHVTDFCTRHGIAQLITIDGKGKQTAGGRSAGGTAGGGGGGGGSGGGGDDGDDDDDDGGDGSVEVDLDALGGDDDGDDGGDDSAGGTRSLGTARVRVQPTGGSGSGSGKAGKAAPSHAHHKSDGKDKDPPKLNANAKDKAKGKGKGGDKKSAKADDSDDDSDSDSDSDSSDSSESDSDADAAATAKGDAKAGAADATDKTKATKGKGKGKDEKSDKAKAKAKEKERSDRILFVTNDSALAVRLRSAEFRPAPVTDAAVSAYTPKPATANAAAADAAAAATAGMSVRLRAWKDGSVRGLTGAVLECAPVTALRVVGLFAAGGSKSLTDVRLSVELVKAVVALCGLQVATGHGSAGIRVKSLAKAARRIETKVRSAVKELTDQHTKSKRVMQSMYG